MGTVSSDNLTSHRPAGRETSTSEGRSLLGRVGGALFSGVLIVCVLAFFLLALGPRVFGYQTSTMLTGSMEPGIRPGDVVLSMPRPVEDILVGDVITYSIPVEDKRIETHRIVKVIQNEDGSTAIRTRGDNNDAVDPWTATLEGDTVWEMQTVIPYLGTAIRTLRAPFIQDYVLWGALAAVLLLGLSLIWGRSEDDETVAETDAEPGLASVVPLTTKSPLGVPAFEAAALRTLSDELDPEFVPVFAARYADMLPARIGRISDALLANDLDLALDATLSLKVSSNTMGTRELETLAHIIELDVRREDVASATQVAAHLADAAARADSALSAYLAA